MEDVGYYKGKMEAIRNRIQRKKDSLIQKTSQLYQEYYTEENELVQEYQEMQKRMEVAKNKVIKEKEVDVDAAKPCEIIPIVPEVVENKEAVG